MPNDVKCLVYKDGDNVVVIGAWLGNQKTIEEAVNFLNIDMNVYAAQQGWDGYDPECLFVMTEQEVIK